MVGLSALPLGSATATEGIACASVHSSSFALESSRARMPVATISPAPINAATPKRPSLRRETGGRGSVAMRHLRWGGGFDALLLVYHAEHHGDKHQGGDRGKNQAADHGAPERGILFPALTETQRHRRHADDHGKRRHQHRTEADEAGFERGGDGIAELLVA